MKEGELSADWVVQEKKRVAPSAMYVAVLPNKSRYYDDEPAGSCDESTAMDMGVPGTAVTVPNDGCLKVTQYPDWWGTRQMQLQNMTPGSYPVPFDYDNCGTTQGSETITADWQSFFIDGISDSCTTLITLHGAGDGDVTLRYYAM